MYDISPYGEYETTWCPGCGNHDILLSVKQALAICSLPPENVFMVSGIGQAAKAPHYLNLHVFNGLHGRALPVAIGAKLANPLLTVLVESGDGCMYGEGGNHFLAAVRRNPDMTVLVHNNGIYGLTKGQASPTSTAHITSKAQPYGVTSTPFNPVSTAIVQGASFVGRAFSGDTEGLAMLIAKGIQHKGMAIIDILTPCVSFNKYNTFAWYKNHCRPVPPDYDPTNKATALAHAEHWETQIFTGLLYYDANKIPLEAHFPTVGPLGKQPVDMAALRAIQKNW